MNKEQKRVRRLNDMIRKGFRAAAHLNSYTQIRVLQTRSERIYLYVLHPGDVIRSRWLCEIGSDDDEFDFHNRDNRSQHVRFPVATEYAGICAYEDCHKFLPEPVEAGTPGIALSRQPGTQRLICSDCGVREAFQPAILETEFKGLKLGV